MAKELYDIGVLTVVDRAALAGYCVAWGRWVEAEQKLTETGGAIIETANKNLIQNPWLAVSNRALDELRRFAIEFGMTPSSRSKVKTAEKRELSLADVLFADVGSVTVDA